MKCVSINRHDYATRAYGNPTADAALNRIMREQERKSSPMQQFARMQ